jgi:hypothetical protein
VEQSKSWVAAVADTYKEIMRVKIALALFYCAILLSQFAASNARADEAGIHCEIDAVSFDGDADVTKVDYMIPPGGKAPRFRLLTGHHDSATGLISVELKARGIATAGTAPLSQEPTWKSVVKLPKQKDSAISSGEFSFSHFDPHGDLYAIGTVQFQTADAHHGQCRFRLRMDVVDLGNLFR